MPSPSELQEQTVEYAKRGDFGATALAANLELTRVAPANEGAWTRLSRCYMEVGQLDEATAALDAVLLINPQNSIARSLLLEVSRRRAAAHAPVAAPRARRASSPRTPRAASPRTRSEKARTAAVAGFGRAEFTTLGHLAPAAAAEALAARIEPLLMALNERPFAAKAVETRNRAGQSGARLFRRNTIYPAGPGWLRIFHQGGRREPQLNISFLSATAWRRDAVGVGIGFDLAADTDGGEERAAAFFTQFQQLVSGAWRSFLSQWMSGNGGFIQLGAEPPSTDLVPKDALARLIDLQSPAEVGWIFYGRWLFADRSADADVLADGRRFTAWTESSFSDLLPLWTSLYRS
ncbi:MAG TPA: tetratricopeptide repeat protein [Vicinamibacterales bacterium]|nr:tetratricopeptide repeat protein [Vicinamibacterales bacterium]